MNDFIVYKGSVVYDPLQTLVIGNIVHNDIKKNPLLTNGIHLPTSLDHYNVLGALMDNIWIHNGVVRVSNMYLKFTRLTDESILDLMLDV